MQLEATLLKSFQIQAFVLLEPKCHQQVLHQLALAFKIELKVILLMSSQKQVLLKELMVEHRQQGLHQLALAFKIELKVILLMKVLLVARSRCLHQFYLLFHYHQFLRSK